MFACADDSAVVLMYVCRCACMCERGPASFNTAPHSCIHKRYVTDLLETD